MGIRLRGSRAEHGAHAPPRSGLVDTPQIRVRTVARGVTALAAERVSKAFADLPALQDVDFDLKAGKVHALIGENGAGKSTLMKILAGVHTDYEGTMRVGGRVLRFGGVRDAERAGIAIIHQELDLVRELTVADNIFLGREPLVAGIVIDRRRIVGAAEVLLRRFGIDIDPESRVAELRVGEQQLVEIAKALSLDARILMMDEPTSALSSSECETLFKVVRQLAADGVAIIFTSHRLDEILALADRVTVLRDGRHVVTAPIGELSRGAIISAMVGHEMAASHRRASAGAGAVVLSVRDLTLDVVSLGDARVAAALRSGPGHVRGTADGIVAARGRDPGGGHAACGAGIGAPPGGAAGMTALRVISRTKLY